MRYLPQKVKDVTGFVLFIASLRVAVSGPVWPADKGMVADPCEEL